MIGNVLVDRIELFLTGRRNRDGDRDEIAFSALRLSYGIIRNPASMLFHERARR